METPKDRSGAAVERIMESFSRFTDRRDRRFVVALETPEYNRAYEIIYGELRKLEDLVARPAQEPR